MTRASSAVRGLSLPSPTPPNHTNPQSAEPCLLVSLAGLCANYLLRRAGKIRSIGHVGALDLGGGSTQITLATHTRHRSEIDPRTFAEAEQLEAPAAPTVALPAGEIPVFTHSHLGWGNKAALALLTQEEASMCLAAGVGSSSAPSKQPKPRSRA